MHASSTVSAVASSTRPKTDKSKDAPYRVVRLRVSDSAREDIQVVWLGTDMQDARLGRLFPGELPQWKPNIGSFFELQHRQRQGDPWIFCRDPRFSHANPNQGSRQRLFVVDDSRKHWAIFSAYFFESSTIGMSVIGLAKAAAAIQRIGISDCDIVVVKQAPNDGRAHALVKHLRNGVGFRGTVYGFAENQRLKSKLKKAGCTTVFGPEASGMLELLGAVFPAGHIG